jgi:hypothetical protein
MTTSATVRAMFECLGFTPGTTVSLEGNDHGINTLEEVVFINAKDIYSLVKQLWHPGGMIVVPTIVGGAAQGNPGPLVVNPGHSDLCQDQKIIPCVGSCNIVIYVHE